MYIFERINYFIIIIIIIKTGLNLSNYLNLRLVLLICLSSRMSTVADPGFSQSWCVNLLFCNFFANNCMKMKEFGGLQGGARVPGASIWIRKWSFLLESSTWASADLCVSTGRPNNLFVSLHMLIIGGKIGHC